MFRILIAAATATLIAAGSAGAITSINDDFTGYGPTSIGNAPDSLFGGAWATTLGTVDYIVTGSYFGTLCRGDGACIDLDGSSNTAGVFSTGSLVDAGNYLLSFTLYGSGRGTTEDVAVTLGDFSNLFTIGSAGQQAVTNALVMVGAGGSLLSFSNAGGDNVGAMLTEVVLTRAPAVVPLPAGLPLMAGALAMLGLLRRRARPA